MQTCSLCLMCVVLFAGRSAAWLSSVAGSACFLLWTRAAGVVHHRAGCELKYSVLNKRLYYVIILIPTITIFLTQRSSCVSFAPAARILSSIPSIMQPHLFLLICHRQADGHGLIYLAGKLLPIFDKKNTLHYFRSIHHRFARNSKNSNTLTP